VQWERILDVNLNRLTESLKLIEDYVRFVMEDPSLLENIRRLRASFLDIKRSIPIKNFILHRQSENDLGREPDFDLIPRKTDDDILLANFSRAKESSRIIEEVLRKRVRKLSKHLKSLRFEIYDLEKKVVEKNRKKFNPRLYVIFDEKYVDKMPIKDMIQILEDNGATMLQLRIKCLPDKLFYALGEKIRKSITKSEFKFIINNRVDIALGVRADGVHLGQQDMPPIKAREILGEGFIIGVSAHNKREAISAQESGADYLGVGAVFPTKTKSDARVCGLSLIREIKKTVDIPVIAIGGINDKNYRAVLKSGADGIAVASFLFEGDLKKNLKSLSFKK